MDQSKSTVVYEVGPNLYAISVKETTTRYNSGLKCVGDGEKACQNVKYRHYMEVSDANCVRTSPDRHCMTDLLDHSGDVCMMSVHITGWVPSPGAYKKSTYKTMPCDSAATTSGEVPVTP